MNKKTLICLIGCALIALGAIYLLIAKPAVESEKAAMLPPTESAHIEPAPALPTPRPGAYILYSDMVIAATPGTKILFFYAPWCQQCRALDKDIKIGGVPDNVTVIKTDYDSHMQLRQKYGVTIQTTFVLIDDAGNLIKKFTAYADPTFARVKESLLQ